MPDEQESQVVLTPEEERDNKILDELWRLGVKKRDEILGADYFSKLRNWWDFRVGGTAASRTPTFRPQIMFSDLHWLAIQEAGDLTDNNPLPVICAPDGSRREDHEKALRGQWYTGEYGMSFYHAALEAIIAGTGILMQQHDYAARGGRGCTYLKWIDTENFVVDSGCTSTRNWQYAIYRSKLSLDEIRRSFPKQAKRLPKFPSPILSGVPKLGQSQGDSGDQLRMPPGPMQQMSFGPIGSGSETRTMEYFFLLDDGRKVVKEIDGSASEGLLPSVETEPAYPYGRLKIRCDRVTLYDGPNPYRKFPFIPVQVHPARNTFWAPPPIRLVIQLQEIAQTLSRQNVENVVRLNNGLVLINEAAGINADEVMGLPGERIRIKSPDGVEKAIKILTPPAFPPDFMNMPDKLLDKMRVQFGQNDTRSGAVPAGNQSKGLYEASLTQASGLTRVRGRLMEPSVKLALEMVYETMLQYQNAAMFPLPNEESGALEFVEWAGAKPDDLEDWELLVDPASMKAMNSAMARQYALLLRNAGLLDVLSTLEAIGWPGAAGIAKKIEQEQAMQLLSKESTRGAPRKR